MCYPSGPSNAAVKVPAPQQQIGQISAANIIGASLDSLVHNGQRLLKLPSASQFPKISGVSLVDPTGQVR